MSPSTTSAWRPSSSKFSRALAQPTGELSKIVTAWPRRRATKAAYWPGAPPTSSTDLRGAGGRKRSNEAAISPTRKLLAGSISSGSRNEAQYSSQNASSVRCACDTAASMTSEDRGADRENTVRRPMLVLEIIFWLSLAALVWTHLGYALAAALGALVR